MFNNTNKIDKLHSRSKGIVDIFSSTIADLSQVNDEISEHIEDREAELERIKAEHARLHVIKADNTKVIDKIQSIFA